MPKLGLTMERGTIAAWLKAEGDSVRKGEPLLEVETDKVTMEVESQVDGVIGRILVPAGEEVDVATPIAIIAAPGEHVEAPIATERAMATTTGMKTVAVSTPGVSTDLQDAPASTGVVGPHDTGRRPHRASPKARKMAAAHGVDLTIVTGSGPAGRILSADIEALLDTVSVSPLPIPSTVQSPPAAVAPATEATTVALSRAQQVAAQRLTSSYREAPHIQLRMEVSAHWLEQFRGGYAAEGKKISYNDLILRGVALSLRQHPRLNSHFTDGALQQLPTVDLGIATDTGNGLVVPVLRDVASLGVEEIASQSRRLVDLARDSRLPMDEMSGGSFTVTNLGMFGISSFSAIINPPQVAILAVGAVERRVVPVDEAGAMGVRPMLSLNLAADHRAIDGAMGARFLQHLRDILQSPALLA
ncbi:MAG: 2-oxo acid dehydrogenase subunit E2 [Gemmatimonadetes bacterium]|nr:2-oxo acid dehydrogenase subunit E2 [Gemmatimonadota bacterium]MBT6147465.1 2-oxo acid dehydrogenase subunit E2 [Gemmatimonadota bacterium]